MGVNIEWHGLEKLTSTIYNAHPKAVEQSIQVVKNKGEKGKKVARSLAPVRKKNGGFLRDHINVTYHGMEAHIYSGASYSGYQEYGTRFMSGKAYMRPMLEQILPEFQKDMTDVMKGVFK